MSAALERLMQKSEPGPSSQQPDDLEEMRILTSILDVVEEQGRQLTTLTERQQKLAGFMKVMDEQQSLQMERLTQVLERASTLPPSEPTPQHSENVESRLSEIDSTLSEFVSALDGTQFRETASALIAEVDRDRTAMASATEQATAQVAATTELVKHVHGAAGRIEKQASAAIEKVTAASADAATEQVVEKVRTLEARTDKVMAVVSRLEGRQLWTAAGAMCLALLPTATVVLGVVLIAAGVVYGWEVAVTTEAATWLRWVKGIGAVLGTGCALFGLFMAVRWTASYVDTWKVTPHSIRWRK